MHGGPGATGVYMQPFSLLETGYRVPVIIYDQLGCGKSTRLRDKKGDTAFWNIDLFVAELGNLIAALRIDTFDLLGHSWGGQLACKFAASQPKGLRKLIIANSTVNIGERTESFKKQMANLPAPFGDIAARAARDGSKDTPEYKSALDEYSHHYMCRLDPQPQEMLDCMAAMQDDDTVSSTLDGPLQELDLKPDLQKISVETVPGGVLVMNSRYDQATDEVVMPYFLLPAARMKWVKLAESGHMSILEEPEAVLEAVGQFLSS